MDAIRNMIGKKGMRKVGYPPPADATKEEREAALEAFKERNSSQSKAIAAEAATKRKHSELRQEEEEFLASIVAIKTSERAQLAAAAAPAPQVKVEVVKKASKPIINPELIARLEANIEAAAKVKLAADTQAKTVYERKASIVQKVKEAANKVNKATEAIELHQKRNKFTTIRNPQSTTDLKTLKTDAFEAAQQKVIVDRENAAVDREKAGIDENVKAAANKLYEAKQMLNEVVNPSTIKPIISELISTKGDEFSGYPPGWVSKMTMPRKWVDIFSMCFIFAFAIILVVAWIMLLNLSIDAHKEMAIATDHQRTCDHVYLEGDSSRAALHNFLTTNDTGTRKTRAQLINTIMQLFLTVYIGTFIVAVIVVWHAAGPTYLYKTREATNNFRCGIFILVSLGIIIWLTRAAGVSTIEDDANQLTRFYFALPAEFSATGKVDRIMMNDMSVHKWTAVVVLTCFAAAYKMSNGYWLLKYMFYICATAAACLAATAYYSPRVFNGGVADYQAVREEFVKAYIALTDSERALICKEARLNMRLKTGRVSDKTCDKDNIFEYVEHQKGKEFMVSPEKEGSMSSQMQQVRKVLSKARKTNDGVTTMGNLVRSVMFLSAILLIIVALQLGDMFPGGLGMVDHMVFHFSGTMWVSIFLFVAILLAVSVAWVKNALMITDSDIPDKKEN